MIGKRNLRIDLLTPEGGIKRRVMEIDEPMFLDKGEKKGYINMPGAVFVDNQPIRVDTLEELGVLAHKGGPPNPEPKRRGIIDNLKGMMPFTAVYSDDIPYPAMHTVEPHPFTEERNRVRYIYSKASQKAATSAEDADQKQMVTALSLSFVLFGLTIVMGLLGFVAATRSGLLENIF